MEETLLPLVSRVGFRTSGRQSRNYDQEASNNQPVPGKRCQLKRSMQHFLEVYWREFEILRFFLGADLDAA
jgi:hypothetical protein